MAAILHVVFLLLIYAIQNCWAQNESTLTFQPPKIKLAPNMTSSGTEVTVTCAPPPSLPSSVTLFAMTISKINKSQQTNELMKAVSGENDGKGTLNQGVSGASASGSLQERTISLVMHKASCDDEGVYVCLVTYYSESIQLSRKEKELKLEGWAQNESTLTFQPPKIKLAPNMTSSGTEVTVTCAPPPSLPSSVGLFAMTISKINKSQQMNQLMKAVSGENDGKGTLNQGVSGASASGSLQERTISLVMHKASCDDEGVYVCLVNYYSESIQLSKKEKELKLEVDPGELQMTSTPPNPSRMWKVNETLTLTCSGPVGSVNTSGSTDDPQIRWQWEHRQPGLSWTPYNGDSSDIVTQPLINRSCYKTQTSTLTRRLTLQDSQREYRCFVTRGNQGFPQLAQSYSVGSVTATGNTEPPPEVADTSQAQVGTIIGATLGTLIVVAVAVIIIYFLVIRPRRRKAQEGHVDVEPESLEEKGTAPPNSAPGEPEVVYSQPSRRGKDKTEGVTNKGLDVSPEKQTFPDTKLSPDNDDKRHGRRHKDKKQQTPTSTTTPHHETPRVEDYDPHYAKLDRRDPYHHRDPDEKPSHRRGRDNDAPNEDNNRRRRRPRDAGDNHDNRPTRYDDNDDDDGYRQGQGRRNRGYEHDNRRRGHPHSSSEDGGNDSYVNTTQYSLGDGDPTMGTAI